MELSIQPGARVRGESNVDPVPRSAVLYIPNEVEKWPGSAEVAIGYSFKKRVLTWVMLLPNLSAGAALYRDSDRLGKCFSQPYTIICPGQAAECFIEEVLERCAMTE